MGSLNQFLDGVVEQLQLTLPLPAGVALRSIKTYGGLTSWQDVERIGAAVPSLWLALLGGRDSKTGGRRGRVEHNMDLQIAVVTCNLAAISRDNLARELCQNIVNILLYRTWGFMPREDVLPAQNVSYRSFFDGESESRDLALWFVEWQQKIILNTRL